MDTCFDTTECLQRDTRTKASVDTRYSDMAPCVILLIRYAFQSDALILDLFVLISVWYLRTRISKVFFLLVFVFYDKKKVNKTTIFVVLFEKSLRLHSSLSDIKRPVCLFLFLKNKSISICQKKASTIQKNRSFLFDLKRTEKRNNFFNCLSAFIVCSVPFITKSKFFSFCFTWTTIKKAKALERVEKAKKRQLLKRSWHGQRKEAFSFSPTDKENCCSAITKLFGFALFFFDNYCTWAEQNKKRGFCWQQNKKKKLFQEVFKSFVFFIWGQTFSTEAFKVFFHSFLVS